MAMDFSKLKDPDFLFAMANTFGQMSRVPLGNVTDVGSAFQQYDEKQKQAQAKATENKTLAWLQQNDPEAYQYAQAGLPVNDAFKYAVDKRQKAQQPKNNWISAGDGMMFNKDTRETMQVGQPKKEDLPTSVDEWNWYQSQTPEKQAEYRKWKMENQSKNGMRITYDEQGRPIVEQGNLSDLKEWQSKDRFWTERLVNAETNLRKYENTLTSFTDNAAANAGTIGNYVKSKDYQLAEQAMKDFLAPVLRKDTGAAVTPGELELYRPLYFPMPGDSKEVIDQKRASRQTILQSLGSTTGIDTSAATNPAAAQQNGIPDLSKMSDAELEALANGQ